MLVEDIQRHPDPSLVRFCANVAKDAQVNPVIVKETVALTEEWKALASKCAWQCSVEEYKRIVAGQQFLRARMIEFLTGLSDAVTKRNEPTEHREWTSRAIHLGREGRQ